MNTPNFEYGASFVLARTAFGENYAEVRAFQKDNRLN
jgi:hypothetical protein